MQLPKIIEEPREAILNNAKSIVLQSGYEELTIRRVAKDAGISVGTVYNYFPTKRALVIQLLEDYWDSFLVVMDQIDQEQPEFYQKLEKIYSQLDKFIKVFREVWLKDVSAGHQEEDIPKKRIFFEKMNSRLDRILVEAQSSGAIHLSTDSNATARFLMMNFFTMALMNQLEYDSFEELLKKLFS